MSESERSQVVSRTVTAEADEYASVLPGVELHTVKTGRGSGGNEVAVASDGTTHMVGCSIGFPIASHGVVGDETVIVHRGVASRAHWCDHDIEPDDAMVYAPGARHAGSGNPGLKFSFVATTVDALRRHAEVVRRPMALPASGSVEYVPRCPTTGPLRRALPDVAVMKEAAQVPSRVFEDALTAVVGLLSAPDHGHGHERRGIDSLDVVIACADYAHAIGRIPSIAELCASVHVSERRLRSAFYDEFEVAPTQYFRSWALNEAHRRLLVAAPAATSVTTVAADLGFAHLGRFAARYAAIHGEKPSVTLGRDPDGDPSSGEPIRGARRTR